MSTIARPHHRTDHGSRRRVVPTLGLVGGALGVLAGVTELAVGPSIRSWVGDKQDTTRLGLVTIVLAAVALASALNLRRTAHATAPRRFALALGLLVPGAICFTTVGRLWFVPGVLLVGTGFLTAYETRTEARAVTTALGRNWTAILTAVLACLTILLGATRLGLAGALGIAGGLVVLALVAVRGRIAPWPAVAVLAVAVVPFAVLTWWSVATPVIALLVLACGVPMLRGARRRWLDGGR